MPKKKRYYLVPGVLDFDPKDFRKPEPELPSKSSEKSETEPGPIKLESKSRTLWEAED